MEEAAAAEVAAADDDIPPLPYETIAARAVFQKNHRSVVRLKIILDSDGKQERFGRGTGFIVLNNAPYMVIMTCGHSFAERKMGTSVGITFHDRNEAVAQVVLLWGAKDLALLVVNTSGGHAGPPVANAASYPAVTFSHADALKGTFVVMLGYPISTKGDAEMGVFHGSVINETTIIKTGKADQTGLPMLSSDYPAAPGASGAPVFGVFGDDDHRVVGFCKGGRKDVAYSVPMSCIRDSLKEALGPPRPELENATLREVLELWLATKLAQRQPAGGAGSQGPRGSSAAGPSSSAGRPSTG